MPNQEKNGSLNEILSYILKNGEESTYKPQPLGGMFILYSYIDESDVIEKEFSKFNKIIRLKDILSDSLYSAKDKGQEHVFEEKKLEKEVDKEGSEVVESVDNISSQESKEELYQKEVKDDERVESGFNSSPIEEYEKYKKKHKVEEESFEHKHVDKERESGEVNKVEKSVENVEHDKLEVVDVEEDFTTSHNVVESVEREQEKHLNVKHEIERGEEMDVVIPYLDEHKEVSVKCPYIVDKDPREEGIRLSSSLEERAKLEKDVDREEIKKRIIDLTKRLLSTESEKEKEEIRKEIKELKETLSVVRKGKEISPLSLLKESVESELTKVLSDFVLSIKNYKESIDNSYQHAKVVVPPEREKELEEVYKKDMEKLKFDAMECWKKIEDFYVTMYKTVLERFSKYKEREDILNVVNDKLSFYRTELARVLGIEDVYEGNILTSSTKAEGVSPSKESSFIQPVENEESLAIEKEHVEDVLEDRGDKEVEESNEKQKVSEKNAFEVYREKLRDIDNMKETELLHYLYGEDRKTFTNYIRGIISKEKALLYAKKLYAVKVKNIPEDIVNSYYGEVEL